MDKINFDHLTFDNEGSKSKKPNLAEVDALVDELIQHFNNARYRRWYCKCIYKLGPHRVQEIASKAKEGQQPAKLFSALLSAELKKAPPPRYSGEDLAGPTSTPRQSPVSPSSDVSSVGRAGKDSWQEVLTALKQYDNSLYAILNSSVAVEFSKNEVLLNCRYGFHRDRLKDEKTLRFIEETLLSVYERRMTVHVRMEPTPPSKDGSAGH